MLKDLHFSGIYQDENLLIEVTFVNPTKYGIDASILPFGVAVKSKKDDCTALNPDDFTFYVMDEANRLYNAPRIRIPEDKQFWNDDASICCPDWLIHTDFQHDFLFQDMRIAFYNRIHTNFGIIDLRH